VIGFVPVEGVRLLPEQAVYLRRKLDGLGPWSDITAVSIGLLYHESEILAIPAGWVSKPPNDGSWNQYARAYTELNRLLTGIANQLAERFGGVAERPTLEGWVDQVKHVNDYVCACRTTPTASRTAPSPRPQGWAGGGRSAWSLRRRSALRYVLPPCLSPGDSPPTTETCPAAVIATPAWRYAPSCARRRATARDVAVGWGRWAWRTKCAAFACGRAGKP
jgi:hypothetical protein